MSRLRLALVLIALAPSCSGTKPRNVSADASDDVPAPEDALGVGGAMAVDGASGGRGARNDGPAAIDAPSVDVAMGFGGGAGTIEPMGGRMNTGGTAGTSAGGTGAGGT